MPKAYTNKNINKLRVYLEKQDAKTTDIKSNGSINKGSSPVTRADK